MVEPRQQLREFLRPRVRFWGLTTVGGALLAICTLAGFVGSLAWFTDVCSHFRVQYLVSLVILSTISFIGRRTRIGTLYAVFAAINLIVILPLYFGRQPADRNAGPTNRAMLINVNTRHGDPVRVLKAIETYKPDIVLLEEVSEGWMKKLSALTNDFPHHIASPRDDNFGIAFFCRLPCDNRRIVEIGEVGVPSVMAEITSPAGRFSLLGTHPVPPAGAEYSRYRNDQLAKIPAMLAPVNGPKLILGDLNVSPWSHYFRRLLNETGLRDSGQGRGIQPTWPTGQFILRIPIDHCLHSPDIVIVGREVGPDVGSDHFPLIVDFRLGRDAP